VAQVVKADRAHTGVDAGGLETLGDLAAVDRVAGRRVSEDEVVGGGVQRPARPAINLASEAVGHRDRAPRREVGLALG
jgi:hypothetical protein